MIRFLGAVGAALIAIAPLAFSQSCDTGELAGGRGGACVISVKQTTSGQVRTIRPLGSSDATKPRVYSGVAGGTPASIESVSGVTVLRGASKAAPMPVATPEETEPVCRYKIRRLTNRRDGERRYDVCLDDLAALNTTAGLEEVYGRLADAAVAACPRDGKRFTRRAQVRCARSAINEAVAASGIEQLALYHARLRSRDYSERIAIVGPEPR